MAPKIQSNPLVVKKMKSATKNLTSCTCTVALEVSFVLGIDFDRTLETYRTNTALAHVMWSSILFGPP